MTQIVECDDPALHGLDSDLGGDIVGGHPAQRFGDSPGRRHEAQTPAVVGLRLVDPSTGDPSVPDGSGPSIHRDHDVDETSEPHTLNPMKSSSCGTAEQAGRTGIELRGHGGLAQAKPTGLNGVDPRERAPPVPGGAPSDCFAAHPSIQQLATRNDAPLPGGDFVLERHTASVTSASALADRSSQTCARSDNRRQACGQLLIHLGHNPRQPSPSPPRPPRAPARPIPASATPSPGRAQHHTPLVAPE